MHLLINTPKASFSLTHIATFRRINRSSVECVDAFRIALTKEQKLLIKQKHGKDSQLSILLSSSFMENLFLLRLQKSADKSMKNHYIISSKTSVNNDKKTYKKQVCNQQRIN